ncbi:hypothetical protein Tco_0471722 [Tanacetum coccineum]
MNGTIQDLSSMQQSGLNNEIRKGWKENLSYQSSFVGLLNKELHSDLSKAFLHYDRMLNTISSSPLDHSGYLFSDTPRNTAYGKAIELMLSKHARNHTPHVLDIGSVKNRLAINDGRTCYGNILLIKISRNSNSLRVLPSYAQTLTTVSEILDSELLGEGLIPTLQHAHENLVVQGYKTVPYKATLWPVDLFSNNLLYKNDHRNLRVV